MEKNTGMGQKLVLVAIFHQKRFYPMPELHRLIINLNEVNDKVLQNTGLYYVHIDASN